MVLLLRGGYMINLNKQQSPHKDALETAFYCGAIGVAGINILDISLNKFVTDLDIYMKLQKYKVWLYLR